MKLRHWIRLAIAGAVLCASMAFAQEGMIQDLFSAKLPKSKIAIADLGDDYRAVVFRGSSGGGMGEIFGNPFGLMMMGAGGSGDNRMEMQRVMEASTIYFTRGETLVALETKFVVAYKMSIDIASMEGVAKGTARPDLQLTLVRFDTIKEIVPRPDVTKASFAALFGPNTITPGVPPTLEQMSAAKSATLSNFKQAAVGMAMYQGDYDDEYPYVQDTKSALAVTMPYVKNKDIYKTQNPNGSQFRMNMAVSGVNASAIPAPADTPLYYESQPWPDGTRCVAFCDTHAKYVGAEEWIRLQENLRLKLPRHGKPLPPSYWKILGIDLGGPQLMPDKVPNGVLPPDLVPAERSAAPVKPGTKPPGH